MAGSGLTLDKIMTSQAIENAIRVLLAIGGSTNGLVHITAVAGRLGIEIDLENADLEEWARKDLPQGSVAELLVQGRKPSHGDRRELPDRHTVLALHAL